MANQHRKNKNYQVNQERCTTRPQSWYDRELAIFLAISESLAEGGLELFSTELLGKELTT